jgi:hypothetical protein
VSRTFVLPDDRILAVALFDSRRFGPMWELSITPGTSNETCAGKQLPSSLADLLGYRVAHEQWPSWIDDLASEIERAFGVSS